MHYNLINEVMSCKCSTTPTVGMMGTQFVGSDRYKVVCVKVLSPKKVVVATLGDFKVNTVDNLDYYDGDINELYERTIALPSWVKEEQWEEGELEEFKQRTFDENVYSLRKNGRWLRKGQPAHYTGAIHWGKADEYRDPCF